MSYLWNQPSPHNFLEPSIAIMVSVNTRHQLEKYRFRASLVQYCQLKVKWNYKLPLFVKTAKLMLVHRNHFLWSHPGGFLGNKHQTSSCRLTIWRNSWCTSEGKLLSFMCLFIVSLIFILIYSGFFFHHAENLDLYKVDFISFLL